MINYYGQAINPQDPQINAVMPMMQSAGVQQPQLYDRQPLIAPGSVDLNGGFAGAADTMRQIGAVMQQRRHMAALRRQSAPTDPGAINVTAHPRFGGGSAGNFADGGAGSFGSLYDTIFGGGGFAQ